MATPKELAASAVWVLDRNTDAGFAGVFQRMVIETPKEELGRTILQMAAGMRALAQLTADAQGTDQATILHMITDQ